MARTLTASLVVALLFAAESALGQTGDGSLRGYVKDEQGGVLPGVTVTGTSPALLAPVVVVTDSAGYYRLNNLPPGTFAISAELTGFSAHRREGIVMRAGLTFSVDIELKVGALTETVTVSGESPMIETSKPTSIMNIDGDLLRAAPVTSRRLFSDVLDLAPGVGSRNVDDGVGRRAYYFHGSHIYAHAFQLEGAPASAYIDCGGPLDGHGRRHGAGRRGQARRHRRLIARQHRRRHERRHAERRQHPEGVGVLFVPAARLERRQHQGRSRAGRPSDLPGRQPVGRVRRRADRQGSDLVLRVVSLRRPDQRHQPDR